MEQIIILNPISPILLISIGIILITIETIVTYFFIAWFGLGFLFVGLLSYFIDFNDGIWQIALASILSLVLLFTLRSKLMKFLLKAKDKAPKKNFLNEKGIGIIKNNKVYYKSIYWTINSQEKFKENEKVVVIEALKGVATIKKLNDDK